MFKKGRNPFEDEKGTLIIVRLGQYYSDGEGDCCVICKHERICHRARMIKTHFDGKKIMFMCQDYEKEDE